MSKVGLLPVRETPVYRVHHAGASSVNVVELLSAVIGGSNQIELAEELLERYGSIGALAMTSTADLTSTLGIGPATAARIHAAIELGARSTTEDFGSRPQIKSPADAALLLTPSMNMEEQEVFKVITVNSRNYVVDTITLYRGSVNSTQVRIAELFRDAVRQNCAGVLLAHNHPSGDPTPSPEDVAITREAIQAGDLLGIEVLDHIVIGRARWISLRERGLGF